MSMAQVNGYCEDRFSSLRTLLQAKADAGEEIGASLAVEIDGKLVVNLWTGYCDETKTQPWQENTVVNVWSTTKSISSLAALMVVERGLLDLDENVSKYWPEFAANGKDNVKVRQVMSHTSGVPAWEQPVTVEDIFDLEKANARLAQQAPWWEPGTAAGYHINNHGHLISELIRRTTGKTLKEFVADELAGPLKADFQLGLKTQDYSRAATITPPAFVVSDAASTTPPPVPLGKFGVALFSPAIDPAVVSTPGWRNAEIGATNGHGNGPSIAKILSPLALGGTVDGVKFLSTTTIDQIFREQALGEDLVTGFRIRYGIGFGLPSKDTYLDWLPCDGRVCGWGGWGGSLGIADLDRRMTIGYAMNKLHNVGLGSDCTKAYVAEIYRVLGIHV